MTALQLATGIAVIGWSGDWMLVHRAKSPGPCWFAITVYVLCEIGVPILILVLRS
jgi:hypothetical protein